MSNTSQYLLDDIASVVDVNNGLFSESGMQLIGEKLGLILPVGTTIALSGDLGAGKTTFSRAICKGLGVVDIDSVNSPTYSIVNEYSSPSGRILHADFYRLRDIEELEQLGWVELSKASRLIIVEWPERFEDYLQYPVVNMTLSHVESDANLRRIELRNE